LGLAEGKAGDIADVFSPAKIASEAPLDDQSWDVSLSTVDQRGLLFGARHQGDREQKGQDATCHRIDLPASNHVR